MAAIRYLRDKGLSLTLVALFLAFLCARALVGVREFNLERADHGEVPVQIGVYIASGHFIAATAENWESEFLAIGAVVILGIHQRQRGSPESKPVHAPHSHTRSG